ncbi:MAG: beta-ketoacyl-[acyl-carrier-protein] synthase family protein [Planctomycetes bacterium]|nr:beta-ketoacyl-[acyl-carrier-protein] synthase family protein [Planctomycetota bacterium]
MKLPVTGMAWTTPLGNELDAVWARLMQGETGIAPVPHTVRLRNSLAGAIPSISLDLPPAERMQQIGLSALTRVLQTTGLDPTDPQLRLIVGTSLGAYLEEAAERQALSGWARRLGTAAGISTEPIVVSTACSSGSDAVLVGAELIRTGLARTCVCGGVDILTVSKRLAHSSMGTMSPTTLHAFDLRHDGTLLGEGAAFVVLQAAETPCQPLAYFRGAGAANDATGMTVPDADGMGGRLAIERSLQDAGLTPQDIGLVNAHGSATPLNDAAERATFLQVFGRADRPMVFATKGNFGHSLGATGATEVVALLLSLKSGQVPPVYGLEQPDPDFPLPLAGPAGTKCTARYGLSLTLGFGGFDTSLVFEVDS